MAFLSDRFFARKGSNAPLIVAIVGIVFVLVGLGALLFTGGYFELTRQRCNREELIRDHLRRQTGRYECSSGRQRR
jgi:hypothetical protein